MNEMDEAEEERLLKYIKSSFIGRMILHLFLKWFDSKQPLDKNCINFTEKLLNCAGHKYDINEFWRSVYLTSLQTENLFSMYVQSYIEEATESGRKLSDIYKSCGMSKQTFLRIKSGQIEFPDFNSVLQLAIGLQLDERHTKKLAAVAGYRHEMRSNVAQIVLKHIEKKNYNFDEINDVLWKKCGISLLKDN